VTPLATKFYGGINSSQEELSEEGPADVSETNDELPPQEVAVLTKAKESESAAALYAAIVADEGATNGAVVSEKALKWPGQEEDEQEDAADLPPILKEATNMAKEVMKVCELLVPPTHQSSLEPLYQTLTCYTSRPRPCVMVFRYKSGSAFTSSRAQCVSN
jgi:hypothetical protein